MNDRIRRRYNMLVQADAFRDLYFNDFKSMARVMTNFEIIRTEIGILEQQAALAVSQSMQSSTTGKGVLRDAVETKLRRIARTARGIAADIPGFAALFRLPDSDNDALLIATARDFIAKYNQHEADFTESGLPAALITRLGEDITEFEDTTGDQAGSLEERVAANASINASADRAMKAFRRVDPIIRNIYAEQPDKLAAWRTASRIESAPSVKTNNPPTT